MLQVAERGSNTVSWVAHNLNSMYKIVQLINDHCWAFTLHAKVLIHMNNYNVKVICKSPRTHNHLLFIINKILHTLRIKLISFGLLNQYTTILSANVYTLQWYSFMEYRSCIYSMAYKHILNADVTNTCWQMNKVNPKLKKWQIYVWRGIYVKSVIEFNQL